MTVNVTVRVSLLMLVSNSSYLSALNSYPKTSVLGDKRAYLYSPVSVSATVCEMISVTERLL